MWISKKMSDGIYLEAIQNLREENKKLEEQVSSLKKMIEDLINSYNIVIK